MKNRIYSSYLTMSISVVAMLVIIFVAFVSGLLLAPSVNGDAQAAALPETIESAQPPAQVAVNGDDLIVAFEQVFTGMYQDNLPSVVNIRVTKKVDRDSLTRFFEFPEPRGEDEDKPEGEEKDAPNPEEGPDIPEEFFNQGGGSGFIWDEDGHIVTNHHVVAGATDIEVTFADDTRVQAELVATDPDADLAVIKVDLPASELTPVRLGDSDKLAVGQLAIAIGNPFGQEFTMTTGIVSGVGRTIRSGNSQFSIPEVIQTDAAINPGNSGGPLFNRAGEVIGINAQIVSRTGSNSGVGFAVPINIAKRIVPTLIQGEEYEYAWLGITGNTLTAEVAEARNISPSTRGAVVVEVAENGPADKAGLQGRDESLDVESEAYLSSGDIITAINGQSLFDMSDLITYLVEKTQPSDTVTLDVIHDDGSQEQIEVALGVRPSAETLLSNE